MSSPQVSIIICTRNRAPELQETLAALARATIPADLPTELVVVDNGSTDGTREVFDRTPVPGINKCYISEPHGGQARARNSGLAASGGAIILFTDDDVRMPPGWIEGMCRPILSGEADAVAGGVRIAAHLYRPWMGPTHRNWVASTETLSREPNWRMVGANMAFSREITSKIPAFDPELGPGALGFGDETLLSHQIVAAGFKVALALDVEVEHRFDASRLTRESFLAIAVRMGRSQAYIESSLAALQRAPIPGTRWAKHVIELWGRRAIGRLKRGRRPEIVELWELDLVREIAVFDAAATEQRRPRQYARGRAWESCPPITRA